MAGEGDIIVKYPLDLSGESAENLVLNEPQTLLPGLNRTAVPNYGVFYTKDLVVIDAANGEELTPSTDYVPIAYVEEASDRSGLEVCAAIVVTNSNVSDNILMTYRVVGGEFSKLTSVLISYLETINIDERTVAWGDLLGKPSLFPPASHLHDIGDIYGWEYVVEAIGKVREAILYGDVQSHEEIINSINSRYESLSAQMAEGNDTLIQALNTHTSDKDNPHDTTKDQVGLGQVDNFSTLNDAVAASETERNATDRFITPFYLMGALTVLGSKAGDSRKSFIQYNGLTANVAGTFYGGTTTPSANARLNYNGYLHASQFFGSGYGLFNIRADKLVGTDVIKLPGDVYNYSTTAELDNLASNFTTQPTNKPLSTNGINYLIKTAMNLAAGSEYVGFVGYRGITPTDGKFHGGAPTPLVTNSTLNYSGNFRATRIYDQDDAGNPSRVYSANNVPPKATVLVDGYMSKEDKTLMSTATHENVGDTLVKRRADGTVNFGSTFVWGILSAKDNIFLADGKRVEGISRYAENLANVVDYVGGTFSLAGLMSAERITDDPTFFKGTNGVIVYNNESNGSVTQTIVTDPTLQNNSKRLLRLSYNGTDSVSPNYGGFSRTFTPLANNIYYFKIVGKFPSGVQLNFHSNDIGSWNGKWIDGNYGTGAWKEYGFVLRVGNPTTMGTTGYFSLSLGAGGAWTSDISHFDIYNLTSGRSVSSHSETAERLLTRNGNIAVVKASTAGAKPDVKIIRGVVSNEGTVSESISNDEVITLLDSSDNSNFPGIISAADFKYNSDRSLKENITDLSIDEMYDKIDFINGKLFNFIGKDHTQVGLIADDVEVLHSLGVSIDPETKIRSIITSAYLGILTTMIRAVKQKHSEQLKTINERLDRLENA